MPTRLPRAIWFTCRLEVGVSGQNGHSEGGLSAAEERSHFGLWVVVSSPLTLSFDLGNDSVVDRLWPVIANPEVLQVSLICGAD